MNLKIYVDEKVKDKFQLQAIKEYDKRLTRYCKMKQVIFKDQEELSKISDRTYKIIVNITGKSISSEELANKLEHLGVIGKSDIAFILSDDFQGDDHICLSSMSMSTGMSLTVLYEQIYRAFRIQKNEPYHK